LTFAELGKLSQAWGLPVANPINLRSIDRPQTYDWQYRSISNGLLAYYNPHSTDMDNGVTIFQPTWQTGSGRWIVVAFATGGIFNLRGSYNPGISYPPFSVVNYLGSSYVSILPVQGISPANTIYWQPLLVGGGGVLAPWQLINSSRSINAGGRYLLDLNLDLDLQFDGIPTIGDEIDFIGVSGSGYAAIDINGEKFNGVANGFPIYRSLEFLADKLIYTGAEIGWISATKVIKDGLSIEINIEFDWHSVVI
jgi:hypothetical protein